MTSPTAKRSTPSRKHATSGRRSACARGSSTHSSWPGGHRPLRRAGRRRVGPVQPRHVGSRPRGPALGRARPTAPMPTAPSSTREPCSRTAPTRRSRSWIPWPASAPVSCARSTSASRGTPSRRSPSSRQSRRRSSRRPGSRVTSGAAASSSPASSPIWSCSTATRSQSRPRSYPEVQVVATMLGGRWVHNPPPWD